jgi:sugar phosphate isomerase/epimerase
MRVAVDGVYFGLIAPRGADDLIALAQEVGADGLNWPYNPDYGSDDAAAMARKIGDAGLGVVSLALTQQISAVPGSEEQFRAAFAACAQDAKTFGTTVVDCWPYKPKEVSKEAAQAVLTGNLDAVVPVAKQNGVVISFEFEPDTTVERFAEAQAFLAAWAPTARLTADTYHIIRIGDDLAEAGATIGADIGVIHFSASHRGEPGSEGDKCDYVAFLKGALGSGFRGDIVLQYAPPEDTAGSLKRAIALTRDVIAECGG